MLKAKGIGTIAILLINKTSIKLHDVAYALDYNAKHISLKQLHDSNIQYIAYLEAMILI